MSGQPTELLLARSTVKTFRCFSLPSKNSGISAVILQTPVRCHYAYQTPHIACTPHIEYIMDRYGASQTPHRAAVLCEAYCRIVRVWWTLGIGHRATAM